MATRRALALAVGAFLATHAALATVSDSNFTETHFVTTLAAITGIAWAPDGSNRLFLVRQPGFIEVVENGVAPASPFATIDPIYNVNECGLLGLALDPNFAENQYVYVYVSVSESEQQIIRYTADGNVGVDKTTIVTLPASGPYHCGGGIGFGADGKLYWSTGDFGMYVGVDDDLLSLGAKVGRANRDGSIPSDNPFVDGDGPNNDLIWARGFRNPFTLTFDPKSERLWVNVAGSAYEQVFAPLAGDHAGWDDYDNNQPAGYITPVIAYKTGSSVTRTITSAVRVAGAATFTTTVPHLFRLGTKVTIAGVAGASFNGAAFVNGVPAPDQFTIAQAGTDATSSAGTATTLSIGNAITGGTFWDSSAVPAEYRGNFFFGDYVSGNLVRAAIDSAGTVESVDLWGSYVFPIDFAVGPDGDLYYASRGSAQDGGNIEKARFKFTSQAIVVSRLHLRTDEGATAAFHVRLAMAPTADTSVTVSPDGDVSVTEGAALTFEPGNWSTPQVVRVAAGQDTDSVDDSALIAVSSPGLTVENVTVRVTDDDPLSIVLSPSGLDVTEGESASLNVSLSGPPPTPLTVGVLHSTGDSDVSVTDGSSMTFDAASWSTAQAVTVAAADDADLLDESATFVVNAGGLAPHEFIVTVLDDDSGDAGVPLDAGTGSPADASLDDGGCGCRAPAGSAENGWPVLAALALLSRSRRPRVR